MFLCINVDSGQYLIADINIDCNSNDWRIGTTYASFMILLYPVGIPMMYLWLLYQVKDDILAVNKPHESFKISTTIVDASGGDSLRNENDNNSGNSNSNNANDELDAFIITHNNSHRSNTVALNNNGSRSETNTAVNDNNDISSANSDSKKSIYKSLFEVKSIRFLWEPYEGKYWYDWCEHPAN